MEPTFLLIGVILFAAIEVFVSVKTILYQGKVLDERERTLRLKISFLARRTLEITALILIILQLTALPDLMAWHSLMIVLLVGFLAEVTGNMYFRWKDNSEEPI